jgi:CHASE3 domain sensor protein
MTIVTVDLLVAGLIIVLVALLVGLASATRRRRVPRRAITEAQARKNAAPLTTAIVASDPRERTDL